MGASCSVKITGSRVASGQIAEKCDLGALLTSGERASFASLLDPGEGESGVPHRVDRGGAKGEDRSKEKKSHEKELLPSQASGQKNAASPVSVPANPSLDTASLRIDPSEPRSGEAAGDTFSRPLVAAADKVAVPRSAVLGTEQAIDPSMLNHSQTREASGEEKMPSPDQNDPTAVEPLMSRAGRRGDNTSGDATASLRAGDSRGKPDSIATPPFSSSVGLVQPSSEASGNPVTAIATGEQTISSTAERHGTTAPKHEVKSGRGGQNATAGIETQPAEQSVEDGSGQAKPLAPSTQSGDAPSRSNTSEHGQDDGGEPHRGSPNLKEVVADSSSSTRQPLHADLSGVKGSGISADGQVALAHPEQLRSAQKAEPGAELKAPPPPHGLEPSATRLLVSSMRGDLRVGVQTEAFGRVTIQTNAQGGQLSAQLSLENTKESAALAAHLPGLEQTIVQQHGLTASVRLVGGFDGGSGSMGGGTNQSGSNQSHPERYQNDFGTGRSGPADHGSSLERFVTEPRVLKSNYSMSSRLDVVA